MGVPPAEGGVGGDDAPVADARIHVERNRDDDASGARRKLLGRWIADTSAKAGVPTSHSIALARTLRKCFAPRCVYKDGELVVRDGEVTQVRFGRALHVTPTVEASMRAA